MNLFRDNQIKYYIIFLFLFFADFSFQHGIKRSTGKGHTEFILIT